MNNKQDSSQTLYYIALVIKGTEEQYQDVLSYVNAKNGAKVIYQCKSLTYLHVDRDKGLKSRTASPELAADVDQVSLQII